MDIDCEFISFMPRPTRHASCNDFVVGSSIAVTQQRYTAKYMISVPATLVRLAVFKFDYYKLSMVSIYFRERSCSMGRCRRDQCAHRESKTHMQCFFLKVKCARCIMTCIMARSFPC